MSDKRPITFGVEFEFIVPQAAGVDSHPHDERWYHTAEPQRNTLDVMGPLIVDRLKEFVPIVEDENYKYSIYAAQERGMTLEPGRAIPYSYFWKTSFDGSVQPRPDEDVVGNYGYNQHPVELSSRVLREDEFDEVALVYRQLRASVRVNLNSSCSFHVHVGTAHLDLLGYKRLVTLVMVCEPFLWRCCETRRRDGWWCLSVAKYSRAARVRSRRPSNPAMHSLVPSSVLSQDLQDGLREIWSATSFTELGEQLLTQWGGEYGDYYVRGAFNVRQIDEEDVFGDLCPTSTAEFRYSHASGDAERDHCFVRICIALVRAAELDAPAYKAMLASFAKGGDFSNFLGPLNLHELYAYCTAAESEYIRRGAEPQKPATEFLPKI